jgi:hypothetical protein
MIECISLQMSTRLIYNIGFLSHLQIFLHNIFIHRQLFLDLIKLSLFHYKSKKHNRLQINPQTMNNQQQNI